MLNAPLPTVTIVVPTYRRTDVLGQTLGALAATTYPPELVTVVVVDNAGDAETEALVRSQHELIVRYAKVLGGGAAAARNYGARQTDSMVIIFNDDDIIAQPDMIARHVRLLQAEPNSIVNGCWDFEPELRHALEASPFGRYRIHVEEWVKTAVTKTPTRHPNVFRVSTCTACNLAMLRATFDRLGGFDDALPFAGAEDQDLSLRAAQLGVTLLMNHHVRLLHNDRRLSLREFCLRQERGAVSAALVAVKHPGDRSKEQLMRFNGRVEPGDPIDLRLRKYIKQLLATEPSLALLHSASDVIERVSPHSIVLRRLYWSLFGLYIFRGVRAGKALAGAGAARRREQTLEA
jgi:GT2 family glycosyltransferase